MYVEGVDIRVVCISVARASNVDYFVRETCKENSRKIYMYVKQYEILREGLYTAILASNILSFI